MSRGDMDGIIGRGRPVVSSDVPERRHGREGWVGGDLCRLWETDGYAPAIGALPVGDPISTGGFKSEKRSANVRTRVRMRWKTRGSIGPIDRRERNLIDNTTMYTLKEKGGVKEKERGQTIKEDNFGSRRK